MGRWLLKALGAFGFLVNFSQWGRVDFEDGGYLVPRGGVGIHIWGCDFSHFGG